LSLWSGRRAEKEAINLKHVKARIVIATGERVDEMGNKEIPVTLRLGQGCDIRIHAMK